MCDLSERDPLVDLTAQIHQALAELTPSATDPSLEHVWEKLTTVTNEAGARLLEIKMGGNYAAAAEVLWFLHHFNRVAKVVEGAPLRIPLLAVRPLEALSRGLQETNDENDLVQFLFELPAIAASLSDHATRNLGRSSLPITDSLFLFARAGSVFQECLRRTTNYETN